MSLHYPSSKGRPANPLDGEPDSPGSLQVPHEHRWAPSTRYTDQPMSLRTRLLGLGGTSLVALIILGGALVSWTRYAPVAPPATISTFDVAPAAAPPEPVTELPPGPEQEKKEQQRPVEPPVEPPLVPLLSENPIGLSVPQPVVDPGPPVQKTTAPEVRPLPPAPTVSSGKPTWEALVLGALNKVKRYPAYAQRSRQQGVPWIRFVMDREGRVMSVRLERSSGIGALDAEALTLPRRAQPLPKPPEDVSGDTIELVVPVEFFLSR